MDTKFTQPTLTTSGIARTNQLTKGAELAQWVVRDHIASLDAKALKIAAGCLFDDDDPVESKIGFEGVNAFVVAFAVGSP